MATMRRSRLPRALVAPLPRARAARRSRRVTRIHPSRLIRRRSTARPVPPGDPPGASWHTNSRQCLSMNRFDEPPADEAASLAPRRNVRLSRAADDNSPAPIRGGWSSRQVPANKSAAGAGAKAQDSGDAAAPASRSPVRDDPDPGASPDDDGPNPLPPALDTAAASSRSSELASDDEPVKVARNTTGSSASTRRRTSNGALVRDDDKAIGIMDAPGEREPRSMPDDILPGARVITPGSSAPIAVNEAPDEDSPPVASPKSSRRSGSPSAGRRTSPPSDADSIESTDPPGI